MLFRVPGGVGASAVQAGSGGPEEAAEWQAYKKKMVDAVVLVSS
jgi:hypothetical protein